MALQNDTVRLVRPAAGATATYRIDTANMKLGLDFTPDPNAVQKVGQNLEFSFEDGGKVVLEGYYDHFAGKTLPVMVTQNGEELPGEQFLASLNEDLLTAAGSVASTSPASGGMNEYADGAGSLVDGVGRLGSLGTDQWARSTEPGPYSVAAGTAFAAGPGDSGIVTSPTTPPVAPPVTPEPPVTPPVAPEPPVTPPVPPAPPVTPPVPPANLGIRYDARAVMYTKGSDDGASGLSQGSGDAYTLTFKGLTVTGITWKDAAYEDYFTPSYNNGVLTLTLTDAGRAALGGSAGNLYSYLELETTEGTYTVQVIVNQDDVLESGTESAKSVNETGGTIADGGLAHGEWHQGKELGGTDGASLGSSVLADYVTVNGSITTAHINTGDGNDIIEVQKDMLGGSTILASGDVANPANDSNSVTIRGSMIATAGEDNRIHTNAGTVSVGSAQSSVGMKAAGAGSANEIDGGSGATAVTVTASKAMQATAGGHNAILNAESVTLDANGKGGTAAGMYALDQDSSNTVAMASGGQTTIRANVDAQGNVIAGSGYGYGMYAGNAGASNSITGEGSVNIDAASATGRAFGVHASANAANTIDVTGGIDVRATSTGNAGAVGLSAASSGANNTLKAGSDVTVTATGTGTSASALDTNAGAATLVESKDGSITLKADSDTSTAQGIWGIGTTTLTAGKDVTVETHSAGAQARAVHTGGNTTLEAGDGNVTLTAEGQTAFGIYTISTGKTTIDASGTVDIQAHGKTGVDTINNANATAMYAESQNVGQLAQTIVNADKVNVAASTAESGSTYAMYSNTALNKINSATTATVSAENQGTGDAWGMFATSTNNKTGANEITGKDVSVESKANSGTAYGMQASSTKGDSHNTITAIGGSATVSAESTQGSAYALRADQKGANIIEAKDGSSVSLTANAAGGSATGMYASVGSNSIISDSGLINVTANAGSGAAYGLSAAAGQSVNSIKTGGDVEILATSSGANAYGIQSTSGGSNKVEADSVDITATSAAAGKNAYGISASGSTLASQNTVIADNITITAEAAKEIGSSLRPWAIGVSASGSGSTVNENKLQGNVDIAANGLVAAGVHSDKGGKTTIGRIDPADQNADYDISINAGYVRDAQGNPVKGDSTETYALYSLGGETTIDTKGDVTLRAHAQNQPGAASTASAIGMYTGAGNGINTVKNAESLTIEASGDNKGIYNASSTGMYAISTGGATNKLENIDTVTIATSATGLKNTAYGVRAETGGTNIIGTVANKVGDVTILANVDTDGNVVKNSDGSLASGPATGMLANTSGASNTVNATGAVTVAAGSGTGNTGYVYGLSATNTGTNTINTEGTVSVSAGNADTTTGSAFALNAGGSGSNTINAGDAVTIAASGDAAKGYVYGMSATTSGANTVNTGGTVAIGVENSGETKGVRADNASNTIIAGGAVSIDSTSDRSAEGLYAYGGSAVNTITTSAADAGGKNAVQINATGSTNPTYQSMVTATGVRGEGGGKNTITAKNGAVDINANTTVGGVYGAYAMSGGQNTIDAKNVSIHAQTADASQSTNVLNAADALYASGTGSSNTINATGTVDLSAGTASAKNQAYGMYAGSAGKNVIQGVGTGSDSGIEVHISVTAGTGANAFAMYARGVDSSNAIIGNSASGTSDKISITGNIKAELGGANTITTGSGDNSVTINGDINGLTLNVGGRNTIDLTGSVTKGGLTFVAGAGHQGADLLILRGSSITDFQSKFGNWLKGLGELTTIETVQVFAPEGMSYLESVDFLAKIQSFFTAGDQGKVELVDSEGHAFAAPAAVPVSAFAAAAAFEAAGHEDTLVSAAAAHGESSAPAPAVAGDDHLHVEGSVDGTVDLGAGHSTLQVDADLNGGHIASVSGSNDIHIHGEMAGDSSIALAGSGNDAVHIDGVMRDGTIDLGNGDDSLHLGGIHGGTVTLGDGNDTVHIGGMMDGGSIDLGDGNDTMYLSNILYGGDINGGEGLDTLNVSNFEALDFNQLITGTDSIKVADFEVLDLTGGTGTTLSLSNMDVSALAKLEATMSDKLSSGDLIDVNNTSLDSYLSNNGDAAVLRIHGDAGDTVNLAGWSADGAVKVDDIDYNVFRVEQGGEEHYLLVQQSIITATS